MLSGTLAKLVHELLASNRYIVQDSDGYWLEVNRVEDVQESQQSPFGILCECNVLRNVHSNLDFELTLGE